LLSDDGHRGLHRHEQRPEPHSGVRYDLHAPGRDGGACGGDGECQTGFCDRPFNDTDGVCTVLATKGMACTSRCATGSTCDTVAGMCVDPQPDGSFCIVDEDCLSANCDNPDLTGGTCVAPSGPTCGPAA